MGDSGQKSRFPVLLLIKSPRDVLYNVATIVNNTVLFESW